MLGAGLRILLSPIGWVMDIVFRGLHIAIVLGLWWFLRDDIDALGVSSNLVLIIALVAVLYKAIYEDLLELFLYFLIILTGGGFLRWMCAGYQSGTGFRQWVMTSHLMSGVIGVMVNVVESTCRAKYEEIMDLYLESNDPDKEVRLKAVLETYMGDSS